MKKILPVLLLFLITNLYAIDNNKYVTAPSGLRLRENPEINSNVILTIPHNEKVEIIEEKNDTVIFEDISGKWTKVKYNNNVGWVFGGFLITKNDVNSVKQLIILSSNTDMYKNFNDNKVIQKLVLFEIVDIDKLEIKNNRIKTNKNNFSGWVNIDKTTYIPKDWYAESRVNDFIIYYPPRFNFEFLKEINKNNIAIDAGALRVYKLYNNTYFITIYEVNGKISNQLEIWQYEASLKEYKGLNAILKIKDKIYYYNTAISPILNTRFYSVIIEKDKNIYYQIDINHKKNNFSIYDEDIAKKIIFSAILFGLNR